MQAVIRHHGQVAHEAQQEGPPCVKPWPLRKLPEDDVRRDALPELAELTKESPSMPLSSGPSAREQAGAQTSHPYETVGLTTASNRRLIMVKDLLHMCALCLALKRVAAPLC